MEKLIEEFLTKIKDKFVDNASLSNGKQIYNEASLQYELAKFLEKKGYSVRLEFNIKDFMSEKNQNFVKRDVDIVAFKEEKKYAIELKFPRKGQYPEQMYKFIQDIAFMQEVKDKCKFDETYCLTVVDDYKFYDDALNKTSKGIYNNFRSNKKSIIKKGMIQKPTGLNKDKSSIELSSPCEVQWIDLNIKNEKGQKYMYYIIKI